MLYIRQNSKKISKDTDTHCMVSSLVRRAVLGTPILLIGLRTAGGTASGDDFCLAVMQSLMDIAYVQTLTLPL